MSRPALLVAVLLMPGLAWADSHSVTVRNGGTETIRAIAIAPVGTAPSDNRMRSQLPPGAEARITYSTGCQADVRLTYASGKTEDHRGVDVCSDPRITAGTDGVDGPIAPVLATGGSAAAVAAPGAKPIAAAGPAKLPPPAIPPWTGKSITKRFGGMD